MTHSLLGNPVDTKADFSSEARRHKGHWVLSGASRESLPSRLPCLAEVSFRIEKEIEIL